jgi:Spy/CpxP family protein refolding chaperone
MCLAQRIVVAAALAYFTSSISAADVAAPPTTAPASSKSVRLTQPWSKLASLTDAQREQIARIHKKALEEEKAARQRETAAILELLSDGQKLELRQLQEKETVERKLKEAERRARQKEIESAPSTKEKAPATK